MSELRWTLLILGVVFIAVLSWWERRRPRQAFAPRLREASLSHHAEPRADRHERSMTPGAFGGAQAQPGVGATSGERPEPWIGDTELSDVVVSDVSLADAPEARGAAESPVRAHREAAVGPLEELPTLVIPDEDEQLALKAAWDEVPPEPTLIDPELSAPQPLAISALTQPTEPTQPTAPEQPPVSGGSEPEIAGAEGVGEVRIVEPAICADGAGAPAEPIVDWPAEDSRRVLALRLVAPQTERFPGRMLRLALAAEGFVLGKHSIFHKPDDANRAVLSAASLSRPGSFDLETMDSQRYGGLSLFAVLPGPKSPPQAFEDLLSAARNLNERLQGALQDERGGPLTPLRVASLRESVRAEAASSPAAPAAAHDP